MLESDEPETAPAGEIDEALRILEALLFASAEPLDEATLATRLPEGADVPALLARLAEEYSVRGVHLVRVAGKWMFRTAPDLSHLLSRGAPEPRKLSRAALETLAIVSYHQPVTRSEIEEIRGVSTCKGTLDVLLETGWVRLRGRRRSVGRPVTYGTTEAFLTQFGLDSIGDLPGLDELKGAGFVDATLPSNFAVPIPSDDPALRPDEDPLESEPAVELDMAMLPAEPEGEAPEGQAGPSESDAPLADPPVGEESPDKDSDQD